MQNTRSIPISTGFAIGVILAALTGLPGYFSKETSSTDGWDISSWLLSAGVFIVATVLTFIGQNISWAQHENAHCDMLLSMWASKCDKAVCVLERELYTITPPFGKRFYFFDTPDTTRDQWRAVLAVQAIGLAAGTHTGQPHDLNVHLAKQSLNRWAEDACKFFHTHNPPKGYLPLLAARARMYLLYAEPLNWAWHVTRAAQQHKDLSLTHPLVEKRLKWHARVHVMMKWAEYETWDGTDQWVKPFKAFWDYHADCRHGRYLLYNISDYKEEVGTTFKHFVSSLGTSALKILTATAIHTAAEVASTAAGFAAAQAGAASAAVEGAVAEAKAAEGDTAAEQIDEMVQLAEGQTADAHASAAAAQNVAEGVACIQAAAEALQASVPDCTEAAGVAAPPPAAPAAAPPGAMKKPATLRRSSVSTEQLDALEASAKDAAASASCAAAGAAAAAAATPLSAAAEHDPSSLPALLEVKVEQEESNS